MLYIILYFFQHVPVVILALFLVAFSTGFTYMLLGKKTMRTFLDKSEQKLVVQDKVQLNHNTIRLRFALPDSRKILGLPVGQHIKIFAPNVVGSVPGKWNGKPDPTYSEISNNNDASSTSPIVRCYTPITGNECPGFVDFVVKVYFKGEHETYVDGGKVSQYLNQLSIGDTVSVSGPVGLLTYHGNGVFSTGSRMLPSKKSILFIAGGTGITPVLQVIRAILGNPSDQTRAYVLYANQTEDDILLHAQLEEYQTQYPNRLSVWYTIDRPIKPLEWTYSTGYVNPEMIKEHFPPYNPDFIAVLCGPPGLVYNTCTPSLLSLGWPSSDILTF